MSDEVVILRHAEMPRHVMKEHFVDPDPQCIIGYYGMSCGERLAVIVGTISSGRRVFHYGLPDRPWEPFRVASDAMVAAVLAYGLRDSGTQDFRSEG